MNPQTIGLTELQKHPADTCREKGWDKVWSTWWKHISRSTRSRECASGISLPYQLT